VELKNVNRIIILIINNRKIVSKTIYIHEYLYLLVKNNDDYTLWVLKELCHGISLSGSRDRGRKRRHGLGCELIISEGAYENEVSRRSPYSGNC